MGIRPRESWRGYDVALLESVGQIDPGEWDSTVQPDDLQATHAFVSACEAAGVEGARYRHVVVRRDSELVGVAGISLFDVKLDLLASGLVRGLANQVRRLHPRLLRPRMLICGLPVSAGRCCLAFSSPDEAAAVVHSVAEAMENLASESRAGVLCFKEFTAAEAFALDALLDRGYHRVESLPSYGMEIPWGTFDQYLGSLRAGYRRQVMATLRARCQAKLQVRTVREFLPHCDRFFPLYEKVMARAAHKLEHLSPAFFRELALHMGPRVSAILVEEDGALAAAAVLLRSPNVMTFFMTGIDYSVAERIPVYPILVTEVLAEAIRSGVERLEMGQTSEALKSRLGAVAHPRFAYLRFRRPVLQRLFTATSSSLFPPPDPPRRRVFRNA